VIFFATPHGVAMAQARELDRRRYPTHRPGRGFPAARSGCVLAVVRHGAHLSGPARRIRLRTA
jgi:hypothetical protein